jgi:hypothetical protein
VSLCEEAPLDEPEHIVGKLEQSNAVRNGRFRPAHTLRDIAEGK